MLKLVLDQVNKLTDEEMRKGGKAVITFDPDNKGTDVAPGAGRADGTFKCFRAGTGINACITARGNLSKELNFAKDGSKAASAVLTADITRKVIMKANAKEVHVPDLYVEEAKLESAVVTGLAGATLELEAPSVEANPDAAPPVAAKDADPNKGVKVTVETAPEKDTEITIELPEATVANGRFVDPNCNHTLLMAPVGPIHVDACAQLRRISGLKPNDHSFSIHVKDDPHAVVFSIVSKDEFDPKEA